MKILRKYFIFSILIGVLFFNASFSYSKEKKMTKDEYLKEISVVKKRLKKEPESPALHNTLGYYYFKIGNHDKAKAEYANAIKYDEKFSVPHNNLGVIALINKEYVDAESHFSDAVELDPNYAKAVYNLSVAYFRQKKYIKAARYYLKAKNVDEEYVNERKDFAKNEKELKEALKKDPDNRVLKYMLSKTSEDKNEESNKDEDKKDVVKKDEKKKD